MFRPISFAGPILTLIVGLIVALTVKVHIKNFDVHQAGWIVAAAGVVWLVVELLVANRRGVSSTAAVHTDPATGDQMIQRHSDIDPML